MSVSVLTVCRYQSCVKWIVACWRFALCRGPSCVGSSVGDRLCDWWLQWIWRRWRCSNNAQQTPVMLLLLSGGMTHRHRRHQLDYCNTLHRLYCTYYWIQTYTVLSSRLSSTWRCVVEVIAIIFLITRTDCSRGLGCLLPFVCVSLFCMISQNGCS